MNLNLNFPSKDKNSTTIYRNIYLKHTLLQKFKNYSSMIQKTKIMPQINEY